MTVRKKKQIKAIWEKPSWRPNKIKKYEEYKKYSIAKILKKQNKINSAFEIMLNNITLEDLIALKLEQSAKIFGGRIYGLPIWKALKLIIPNAAFKYAISVSNSRSSACYILGISPEEFYRNRKKYNVKEYFEKFEKQKDVDAD